MFVTRLPNRSIAQDDAAEAGGPDLRHREVEAVDVGNRSPERRQLDALREPRGGGCEAIAPFERAADGWSRVAPLGQLDDLLGGRLAQDRGQHAVVRCDETVVARVERDAATCRADAGVHDRHEDRARWKVFVGGGELERPRQHIVGGDVVGEIDQRDLGTDGEDHALHGPGVVIPGTEVGQQRNEGAHVMPASAAGFRACCS